MKTDHSISPSVLAGAAAAARMAHLKRSADAASDKRYVPSGAGKSRVRTEHFCALSSGTKRVLQWRAYLAVALLTSATLGGKVSADDEALYSPVAPVGSAFVRVFNASTQVKVEGRVGDKPLSVVEPYSASDFVFLPAGSHTLSMGSKSQPVDLKQDHFYTAVVGNEVGGGNIQMFDNEGKTNRLKALLLMFNLTDKPVSLRTADGAAVFEDIAPGQTGTRPVNAVKTRLALFRGADKISEVAPVALARGKAFSLFVTPSGEHTLAVWAVTPPESEE